MIISYLHKVFLVVAVVVITMLVLAEAQASKQETGNKEERRANEKSNNIHHDWEDMNHYEILYLTNFALPENHTAAPATGTPSQPVVVAEGRPLDGSTTREERIRQRQSISKGDVRRAYYKAAKLHHPDKRQQRQEPNKGDHDTPLSYEEVNARMARISEAYQVLSDDAKRKVYDAYLLRFEENQERKRRYAEEISKPCRYDEDCSRGQCCIEYHFNFCGVRADYPAQGLTCAGPSPRRASQTFGGSASM